MDCAPVAANASAVIRSSVIVEGTASHADCSAAVENATASIAVVVIECTVNHLDHAGTIVEASAERWLTTITANLVELNGAIGDLHCSRIIINATAERVKCAAI